MQVALLLTLPPPFLSLFLAASSARPWASLRPNVISCGESTLARVQTSFFIKLYFLPLCPSSLGPR